MTQWPDLIERQVASVLSKKCTRVNHFTKDGPEQLWIWQGQRRVDIKDALGLELPTIYGPPRFHIAVGQPGKPELGQLWKIETTADQFTDLYLHADVSTAAQPTAFILRVFDRDDPSEQKDICRQISQEGLIGLATHLRGAAKPEIMAQLAEIYLGIGRCFAGAVVSDFLRIIDHIEHQFNIDGTPIVLILSGLAIPMGLAMAAIDQRISALVVDFDESSTPFLEPSGRAPLFINQYLHLGANPFLVLCQCYAPRPLLVIHRLQDAAKPWLSDSRSGILSFAEQLDLLKGTYDAAGYPDRVETISPDNPRPNLTEMVKISIEYYTGSGE